MNKWFWILGMLWLAGCGTDSDDGLTDDERRSKEIWSITSSNAGLWATYTPVPDDFTIFSDSILVQKFLDTNGLTSVLTVRDVARPEADGKRFKSIRIDLRSINIAHDTLLIPESWSQLQISEFFVFGKNITSVKGLENLSTLQDLRIAGTGISSIPKEVRNFDLVMLAFHSNEITELPEWIIDFVDSNRILFSINDNKIQDMPENLLQKHWHIEIFENSICDLTAADSTILLELSKPGSGGYKLPDEYLSNPALGFFPQNCD